MQKSVRFTLLSILVVGAYILSACSGAVPQPSPSTTTDVAQKVQAKEIAFTGIVEAMSGNQWLVSGKVVTVDPSASMDPNIAVGDIVKVEGSVSADGVVVAVTIESSTVDDNANGGNANDGNVNGNANDNTSNDDNSNSANGNANDAAGNEPEVLGIVEAVTADSVIVNGVAYQFASFTEIKDAITVGDQVKLHVIVNADGTFTIREIEKSDGQSLDDNSNSANSNDDNGNDSNSNDDNGNDSNSNDDNGNDSNSNDDNGNDGNSNDNGSNDNGGSGGGGSNDNGGGGGDDDNGGGSGGNDNDD